MKAFKLVAPCCPSVLSPKNNVLHIGTPEWLCIFNSMHAWFKIEIVKSWISIKSNWIISYFCPTHDRKAKKVLSLLMFDNPLSLCYLFLLFVISSSGISNNPTFHDFPSFILASLIPYSAVCYSRSTPVFLYLPVFHKIHKIFTLYSNTLVKRM